ncbi:GerAB/ArcD/ProY family transporter [Paenibacillus sp. GM2]|uniref:GerAB/ArcD/ProY family transporter n=1 Tax=Paenibacillus sp. GM2 TaxID=1622070 RepID=UPI000839AB48|nr:GerAB/ArcD/ProY family transporter [Paenibacillus sp. GM2]
MRTTPWQLFRFAFVYFNSQSAVFLVPALLSNSTYQAWIGIIGGYLLSLMILLSMIYIGSRYPDQPWVQFGKSLMGKWLHGLFVLLLLLWCIYYTSYDIESFALFFGSNYLRDTPPWFIQAVIVPVIIYTALRGFRIMAYMSDGLFLLIISATFLMFCLFSQQADFRMLSALTHYWDMSGQFTNSLTTLSWFADWVVFFFIVPEMKLDTKVFKNLLAVATTICVLVILGWLLVILNFTPDLGRQFQYPYLEIIRSMEPDRILSKVAPLLIGLWTTSMFLHSSFLIYTASRCAMHFTKGKGNSFFIVFCTLIAMVTAFYYANHLSLYQQHYYSFEVVIIWAIVECIPVYYTAAYLIGPYRRRKKAPPEAETA